MCGIVSVLTARRESVVPDLIRGLELLEYRGYDSAGFAVLQEDGALSACRGVGKISHLKTQWLDADQDLAGQIGIAHTRWATHGAPSEANAHPVTCGEVAVVCNGIIENHTQLRAALHQQGARFYSDTDTEVIAHLLARAVGDGASLVEAVRACQSRLHGAFSFVAMRAHKQELVGLMGGCPLVVSWEARRGMIASDARALALTMRAFHTLARGDVVAITPAGMHMWNAQGQPAQRQRLPCEGMIAASDKGNYSHFILKEMHEQPRIADELISTSVVDGTLTTSGIEPVVREVTGFHIVGCGSSYFAGALGAMWLRRLTGLPAQAYIASEYHIDPPPVPKGTLFVALSQSGETADTLLAQEVAQASGTYQSDIALINVTNSQMHLRARHVLRLQCGPEICVLSTKSMLAQMLRMLLLALTTAKVNPACTQLGRPQEAVAITQKLTAVPAAIDEILERSVAIRDFAAPLSRKTSVFYLGRGLQYIMGCEGALKLMEGAYIHAQAYPAGELKHGPLAYFEAGVPVVALLPQVPTLAAKVISNLSEIASRHAEIYVVGPKSSLELVGNTNWSHLELPIMHPLLAPFVELVVTQLIAVHISLARGTDIDQPRNLAKSVTVE